MSVAEQEARAYAAQIIKLANDVASLDATTIANLEQLIKVCKKLYVILQP